jgi:F-type H+-transporting ATPase subunit delta
MRSGSLIAARRYADALLEVAAGAKADLPQVRQSLGQVAALLREHAGLAGFFSHPGVAADRKQRLLDALTKGAHSDDPVPRLLRLLVERRRLELLPAIEQAYVRAWNERRGVIAVEAVSAAPLGPEQIDSLRRRIETATGRSVDLEARVDTSLIGGVLVKIGGRTIDGTARGYLKALRTRVMHAVATS